jgi:tyrosyl-tRNA synthetase
MSLLSTYQLIQGYDFIIYKEIQLPVANGGFRPMGNITTGTELVRRMNEEAKVAMTCPLITKADGSKFGKLKEMCG